MCSFNKIIVLFIHWTICRALERFEEDQGEMTVQTSIPIDERIAMSRIPVDFETSVLKMMMTRYFPGRTRFQMAVRYVIGQVSSIIDRLHVTI